MYLKSIEVHGFKSFAQKTVFDFHEGITGIVGPNGSGKSNVADAVRWVFGEQSAKQLRGSSMQDVIFSGTAVRKPLSFASVSITLSNENRELPLDFDEVVVTRKVYRSGESEYILNGNICRLKDINELFYDTGIGKDGYSIIGQGQVDRILSAKPDERRELFDEACGIVKYKKRKNEANKKLESERANMVRVSDILNELEKQVGPLKKQSEDAKEYIRLKDELKTYDIQSFIVDHSALSDQLKKLDTDLKNTLHELSAREAEEENLKKEYQDVDAEIKSLDEKTEQVRETVMEATKNFSDAESKIAVYQERINQENISKTHYEERIQAIDSEVTEKESAIEKAKTDRDSSKDTLGMKKEENEKMLLLVHDLETKLSLYRQSIEESHGKTLGILTEKSEVNANLEHLNTLLSENEKRAAESEEKKTALLKTKEDLEHEIDELLNHIEDLEKELKDIDTKVEKGETEFKEADENFFETQQKLTELAKNYQITKSRYETLKSMAERYEGFNPAVRFIMDKKSVNPGIEGTVADLFHVDSKYQTAIETALGGNFQNVVVDSEDTAKSLVNLLKENRAGRATFLPLDSITPTGGIKDQEILSETGALGTADSLVNCSSRYKDVARYLLERFLAVDNMDNALRIAKKYHYSIRIVTLEGEFLNVGGSISGGAFKSQSNVLSRSNELEKLEKDASEIKSQEEELQKQLNRFRQIRENASMDAEDSKEEQKNKNILLAELKASFDSKSRLQSLNALEIKETETKLQELRREKLQAESEQETIKKTITELESMNTESKDLTEETNRLIADTEKEYGEKKALYDAQVLEISKIEQSLTFLDENEDRFKDEIQKLREEQVSLREKISLSDITIEGHEKDIESFREELETLRKSKEDYEGTLKLLLDKKEEMAKEQKVYFNKRDELSNLITELSREEMRLENQQEKINERLDSITEYMWSEYELLPTETEGFRNEEVLALPVGTIRKHTAELRSSIRSLGAININAIDDYKEVSERYEFMKKQYDDLVMAETDLLSNIHDLEAGMRKEFSEKIEIIRAEFDKSYKELFGGGVGKIEIQPDVDLLDAEISILSTPPGKKLNNMMQLSGGEKALTAIALIFAIQKMKPSPFCLLDEIEAALDDTNVGRFATYLRRLTDTQFIVITHRRGTMVAADRLYGITMQEKGVSKLVSVNLIQEQLDA